MIEERGHLLPLAEQGFELAEMCFARVDGLGRVRVRTNLYSVPVKPEKKVEVRLYPVTWKSGMKAAASPGMNAITDVSRKCSIWSITSMCWSASLARWREQSRRPRRGKGDCGRRVTKS
jgi:hypothetical protein